MESYIVLALFLPCCVEGSGKPQCAGKEGSVMFQPDTSDGNVTGIQRYSKQGRGDRKLKPFANYDTTAQTLTHFEAGRNISVVNKFSLQFQSLQKSDDGNYSLSLSIATDTKGVQSRETTSILIVQDRCFDPPVKVGKCYNTRCFTSNNGTLEYKGKKLENMDIEVCNQSQEGTYKCCSPGNVCKSHKIISDPKNDSSSTKSLPLAALARMVMIIYLLL